MLFYNNNNNNNNKKKKKNKNKNKKTYINRYWDLEAARLD